MKNRVVRLRDVASLNISNRRQNEKKIAYLDTGNIIENRVIKIQYFDYLDNIPSRAKRKVKEEDTIFSMVRPNQKHFGYINRSMENLIVSTGFSVVTPNKNKINSRYLFYLLTNNEVINIFQKLAEGCVSTYPTLSLRDLLDFEFKLPSLEEQKRIADILTALDDKIELNNQMNQTLEEIASLLYKRWFVDFEFPDDKGNPYKSSGGEMVDSELGMIPKGWEVKELGEICVNSDSKRKPLSKNQRERLSGDYPYYGAASIIDYVNDYIFDGTYLLVGEDGTVVTKDGKPILQYITGKIWVNNHAHVLQGKDVSTGFLFCKLSQFDVTHLVTGAVQMKITQSNLNKIKFVISESNIQKRFEKIITLLFNKRNENKIYNEALKKIKKELVIKLI